MRVSEVEREVEREGGRRGVSDGGLQAEPPTGTWLRREQACEAQTAPLCLQAGT